MFTSRTKAEKYICPFISDHQNTVLCKTIACSQWEDKGTLCLQGNHDEAIYKCELWEKNGLICAGCQHYVELGKCKAGR